MLHSRPPLPPATPTRMSLQSFSPSRSRKRPEHERHGSEAMPRGRPISIAMPPASTQRASMYISDASIILAQRTPMASPVRASLLSPSNESPSSATSPPPDHYAILELDFQATTEDVKAAYRRLRVVYFSSDATKYLALQAAFTTLMDADARQAYDRLYASRALAMMWETPEGGKHERKDSGQGSSTGMAVVEEEEEGRDEEDPNWGLKHQRWLYDPVIGTVEYHSYVPVAEAYVERRSRSRRPTYVGEFAVMARPA